MITMKKTRCVYIARTTLPSTAANAVHIMKISSEFNKIFNGSFRLLVHERLESTEALCDAYGTEVFPIDSMDIDGSRTLFTYEFAWKAAWYARKMSPDVVITRDPLTALLLGAMGVTVVLDLHGDVRHLCGRGYHFFKIKPLTGRKNIRYCAITFGLRDYYIKEYGSTFEKMYVLPDGVTLQNFVDISMAPLIDKESLSIGYIGKLTVGKGVDTICALAKQDSENHYVIYGGSKEEAEAEINNTFSANVTFGGYVDNKKVPSILESLDVVLLPNKAEQICQGENIGHFTSPLKMFEYMASGCPIIASDIPVLKEILNNENSFLVPEDDISAWVKTVRAIQQDPTVARKKAVRAKSDVQNYTWESRARNMLKEAGVSTDEI